MTSYAEVVSAFNAIQAQAGTIMASDTHIMERRTAQLVAQANQKAAAAKLKQLQATALAAAGGPVLSGAVAIGLQAGVASAEQGVGDALARQARVRASGDAARGAVAGLLDSVGSRIDSYAVGENTEETFLAKSQIWSKAQADLNELQAEMNQYAAKAAWTSAGGSSALYEQRVPPQTAAVNELAQVARNSSSVSIGVATLQSAIYTANLASLEAVGRVMGLISEGQAQAEANSSNIFFRRTMTIQASLGTLLSWMATGAGLGWTFSSLQLANDLAMTIASLKMLPSGWPGRTADGTGGGGAVADVEQHEYNFSEANGRVGDAIAW